MALANLNTATSAASSSFAALLNKITYLDSEGLSTVRRAYKWADELHLGQLRHSGEPYITHPIAVAAICADWKLDAQGLCAALLHDALEDCDVTKNEIIERFGTMVAELVDGLTKLEKLPVNTREESQAESFRKMLLAMASDVRVILIKLADRTHNMRTLNDAPQSKWSRIATETQDIYAPIAHRLGLNAMYRELQDLSFRYLKPWRYETLIKATVKARARAKDLLVTGQKDLEAAFAKTNLNVAVSGREKTLYSIYHKMQNKHLGFDEINDLYGFRIIVPNVSDCYTALGVLHQLYKPVPGRFKDHIAIPKLNGYQSLHTTLVGPSAVNVEIQIRTEPMSWIAESGVAAHWLYKAAEGMGTSVAAEQVGTRWLQSLLDIQNETREAAEFWDHVRVDLFPDAVYVFTPKGKIMALPRGATVVDFAYAVHSRIGDQCMAAKLNGEMVPLRSELKNGDIVEVVTAPVSTPNPAWLSFVRSGRARSRIRQYLKTQAQSQSQALGEKLLEQAMRAQGFELWAQTTELWDELIHFTGNKSQLELFADLGLGRRMASVVAKRLSSLLLAEGIKPDAKLLGQAHVYQNSVVQAPDTIVVDGSDSASVVMAACCHPIPTDEILGYLGHGEGLTIHRTSCPTAIRQKRKTPDRIMNAVWSDAIEHTFNVPITVVVTDGHGVLAHVTSAIATAGANIVYLETGNEYAQKTADLRFRISVNDSTHLDSVLKSLARVTSVLKASRD